MKKQTDKTSALRTPLNDILSSRGHILIIRQLIEINGPTSHSELIKRSNLSRQGVYDVVNRLVETGILDYVGSGRQQQLILRKEHPLTYAIVQLFKSEKERYDSLINELQEVIKNDDSYAQGMEFVNKISKSKTLEGIVQRAMSVWIFGEVAKGEDDYGNPVQIAALGTVKSIDSVTENLRNRLYQLETEKKFDVTIEIRGITKADLETRPEFTKDIILLFGVDPRTYLNNGLGKKTQTFEKHSDLDARTLADANLWVKLLKKYPEIISRTINHLEKLINRTTSGEKKELQEWNHILKSMSYYRLKKFMESDSERSVRLRQSLPFWEVLNDVERKEFIQMKKEKNDYE